MSEHAVILRLFVKIGDRVNIGDPVVEIETELAIVTIPAATSGAVVAMHVHAGERVPPTIDAMLKIV